jgi:hypothetical protein
MDVSSYESDFDFDSDIIFDNWGSYYPIPPKREDVKRLLVAVKRAPQSVRGSQYAAMYSLLTDKPWPWRRYVSEYVIVSSHGLVGYPYATEVFEG